MPGGYRPVGRGTEGASSTKPSEKGQGVTGLAGADSSLLLMSLQ